MALLTLYNRGMNSSKSDLIEAAIQSTGCTKKQVMNFIYNQNKRKNEKTDIPVFIKEIQRNKFQSFQSKLARDIKLYGGKYTNKTASSLWQKLDQKHKTETIQKRVRSKSMIMNREKKIKQIVSEIAKVNVCTIYARVSGKDRVTISNSFLQPMVDNFLQQINSCYGTAYKLLEFLKPTFTNEDIVTSLLGLFPVSEICLKDWKPNEEQKAVLIQMVKAGIFSGRAKRKISKLSK